MTRREILERRKRRKRVRRIRMAIKISVYALFALLVVGVVWGVATPIVKKLKPNDVDNQEVVATAETLGSGDAARVAYTGKGGNYGWNVDETGWWYLNGDDTYFSGGWQTIDGEKYYFKEDGRMATGWVDIGDESHYFKADGTEDADAHQKLVAITYDDGPSANTTRLLNILEEYNVKATFFVVGQQAETYPDIVKREDELGMEIGSHTYDHTYLSRVSAEEIEVAMSKNEETLTEIIGHGTTIMRPTGGGINDTVRQVVDLPMICWDVDTLDWKSRDADSVTQIALDQVQDGSIILMHDLYESTVDASERIIPELLERGYKFVTISELAARRGVTLQGGMDYYDFYPQTQQADTSDDAA